MLIQEIYKHNHKLANTPLRVRFFYFVPPFTFSFFSQSPLFQISNTLLLFFLIAYNTNISFKQFYRLIRIPALFIIISCLTIAISFDKTNSAIEFGKIFIAIEKANLDLALLTLTKSFALVSCMYFLLLTHSISDIARIMRALRFPPFLIELFILTYKFIINLLSSVQNLITAQRCRNLANSKTGTFKSFAFLVNAILRQAITQTSHLDIAVASRLGDNNYKFTGNEKFLSTKMFITPTVICLLLALNFYFIG